MKRILLSLAAALCMCASAAAQTVAPFKDGDRAVFLGNSITDGGHYHSYIWLYYMTRFPYMDLRVMNAGIGGETAGDMYKRLDGDVFSKRPTVLTVTFGMNDTGYMEYNGDDAGAFGEKKYRECYDNFKKMEKRLQTLDGVRVVMLGGSPYDETAQIENNAPLRGKNAVMDRVVGFQKESAAANGWEFVDFSAPMVEIGRRVQAGQPSFSLSMGDRIHPDNDGHMVMAYLYLKAQGFAGREVADVQIDAANAKVLKAGNCEITGLRRNGREISFDYLAEALPYPLDTLTHGMGSKRSQAEATKLVPFIEEMNREMLTVKGLKGDYTLYIDGERIGTWSGKQLGEGINLAELQTPQYRQAMEVMHLNEYRWEIERNFRDYAWVQYDFFQNKGLLDANDAHAVRVLDAEKERTSGSRSTAKTTPSSCSRMSARHARCRWNCSWKPSTRSTSRRRARSYCARTDPGRLQTSEGEADAASPCLSGYSHLRAAPGSPKPSRPHIPARRPAAMPVPAPETTPGTGLETIPATTNSRTISETTAPGTDLQTPGPPRPLRKPGITRVPRPSAPGREYSRAQISTVNDKITPGNAKFSHCIFVIS